MEEFAKGDRVRAKEGNSRVMIIEQIYAPIFYYRYRCAWQDANGMFQHELFRAEQLARVPSPA
jgi:uncharacterized protein YodC (DUF2158 family)